MKAILSALFLSALTFMSCSNTEDDVLQNDSNPKTLDLFGTLVEQHDGMLKFSDELSFEQTVKNVALAQIGLKKLEGFGFIPKIEYTLKDKGFHSMYDDFVEAIDESGLYYDRWEDYAEYKIKYPNLYFPEFGDDYSAYLPISNPDVAKLANSEGNIMIGDKIVSCKNISSYEELEQLGLTPPNPKKRSVEVFYLRQGDDKIWVNAGRNWNTLLFEVCFRDKGFLGIWHNKRTTTALACIIGGQKVESNKESMSSHNYTISIKGAESNGPRLPPVFCNLELKYGPFGSQIMRFSCTLN